MPASNFGIDAVTLVIDATIDPLLSALNAASGALTSFASTAVGVGAPVALAFAGVEASIKAVQGVIEGVTESVVGFNDSMFRYSLQLSKVMDQNLETAAGRLLELQDLSRNIEFSPESLASAERIMRQLGGSALDTAENIKLFADAATGTGNKIETVAQTMSRLYGVIQEGQPIGRLSLQLQRMGLISAETIGKVQRMQEAGASADEAWKAITDSLQKFIPAAEEAVGSVEKFSDMIQRNAMLFNQNAFRPLYEGLRDFLHVLNDALKSDEFQQWGYNVRAVLTILGDGFKSLLPEVNSVGQALANFAHFVGDIFIGLINTAAQWGAGLMEAYAAGLEAGVNLIIGIIEGLANLLADLLAPGSPPKFLPFIDKWGIETANLYVQGFSQASMDPINELSKLIEDNLRNAFRTGPAFDLEDAIMNMRVGIVEAMHDIDEFGKIQVETWEKIHEATAPLGDDVDHIVEVYLDLAEAQKEVAEATERLRDIQNEYNDAIRPLDREIDTLQTKERILRAQTELGKALENQAKGKDPGGVGVEAAQLKMAILQAQIKKDQIKLEFKDKQELAEDEERAAKKRQENDKDEIDNLKNKSQWMKDNLRLWDEFNKPPSGGGGGAKEKGGRLGSLDNFTEGLESARKRIELEKKKIEDAITEMKEKLQPAIDAFTRIGTAFDTIGGSFQKAREEIEKILIAWGLLPSKKEMEDKAGDMAGAAGGEAGKVPEAPDPGPWEKIRDAIKSIKPYWDDFWLPFQEANENTIKKFPGIWDSFYSKPLISIMEGLNIAIQVGWELLAPVLRNTLIVLKGVWDTGWSLIRSGYVLFLDAITGDWDKWKIDHAKALREVEGIWKTTWDNAAKNVTDTFQRWYNTVMGWINGVKSALLFNFPAAQGTGPGGIRPPGTNNPTNPSLGTGSSVPDATAGLDTQQTGTHSFRGGLALVGEQGPELVNLPSSSRIFNNSDTQNMISNMGAKSFHNTPTYIINGGDPKEVERAIGRAERRTLERLRDVFGSESHAI